MKGTAMKMKKYLIRKEWATVCHEYSMAVTPQLVQEYNDYIKANFIFKDDADFELTEQDLINAWGGEYIYSEDTILNTVVVIGRKYQNGEVDMCDWKQCLGDLVQELLSDEMWEQDYDEVDYNTDEVSDFTETYDF
jgi:hypothetical protein